MNNKKVSKNVPQNPQTTCQKCSKKCPKMRPQKLVGNFYAYDVFYINKNRLNEPFREKWNNIDIPLFKGSYADFLTLSLLKIISESLMQQASDGLSPAQKVLTPHPARHDAA